jgi:hypothetical protein
MTKTFYSIFIFFFSTTFTVFAQPTTSSPYSKFGLGDLVSPSLPQNKAMGGISVGLRKLGSYSSINVANPASYSSIDLTTFDMGAGASFRQLDASSAYNNNVNMNLSHIVFGVPVSKKSAISFGLLPYSEMGYQYKNSSTLVNTTDNTSTSIDYIYGGDGGLSKVYMGYGILLSPHLSVGVNAAYLFGNLKQSKSTEFPQDTKALNSRQEASSGISGLSMDYGVQYIINTLSKSKLTIGYAGTISDKFTAAGSTKSSVYRKNFSSGDESISLGTPYTLDDTSSELSMPIMQTIGFAFEKANKFLVGADFSYAQWSNFRWGAINPGLNDSYTVVVGGQVTPNVNAISGYFKLVDYRFGLKYNKTFVNINNTGIDQYAVTLGLGLPLAANRLAFYKINFSAEIGMRGRLDNGLVRENYVNLGLGFTINDKWFIKPKFD